MSFLSDAGEDDFAPAFSLRGFWWNVRCLGPVWWLKCAIQNARRSIGLAGSLLWD